MSKKNKKDFIGRKFEAIHKSRELAVQFLYSLDIYPQQDFNQSLELFLSNDDFVQSVTPDIKARCQSLASQVMERKNEIDVALLQIITGWRPDRMVSVDRTILRLMVFEGFILKSLPVGAAVKEATRLAGDFGTKESARFVGGVMYKAAKFFEKDNNENENENGAEE